LPRKPRTYRLGQRQTAVTETRARIVAAAHALLATPGGFAGFTIDGVAERAGVARMTVFNQFGSKIGLLEALFDDLAARGLKERLLPAFLRSEPRQALKDLIAAFASFWHAERIVIRRIRSLTVLDTDFEQAVRARDERRREGLRSIVDRIAERYGKPAPAAREEIVGLLHTLTSFETFDHLAGASRSPEEVVPLVCQLAQATLKLDLGGVPETTSQRRTHRCP
jgi:AcrR family transcriptional regulator